MDPGPGVILLLVLWICTGLSWIFSLKLETRIRLIIPTISLITTVTLLSIPIDDSGKSEELAIINFEEADFEVYDYLFYWKLAIIIMLIVSIFVGIVFSISFTWNPRIYGSDPVSRRKCHQWSQE